MTASLLATLAFVALLAFALPIILSVLWGKKYRLHVAPMFFGLVAFVFIILILEPLVYRLLLSNLPVTGFVVTLGVLVIVCVLEELSRLLTFMLTKENFPGLGSALSFGIGFAGCDAIMNLGAPMLNNFVSGLRIFLGDVTLGDPQEVERFVQMITQYGSSYFLTRSFEMVVAFMLQIALSLLVWYAFTQGSKKWFSIAILLHLVVRMPALLLLASALNSVVLVETLYFAGALVTLFLAVRICRTERKMV